MPNATQTRTTTGFNRPQRRTRGRSVTINRGGRNISVGFDLSDTPRPKKKANLLRVRIYNEQIIIPPIFETKKKFLSCVLNGRPPSKEVSVKQACAILKKRDKDYGHMYYLKMFLRKNANKFDYLNHLMVCHTDGKKPQPNHNELISAEETFMDTDPMEDFGVTIDPSMPAPTRIFHEAEIQAIEALRTLARDGQVSQREATSVLGIST